LFGLGSHISSAEPEGSDPGRIKPPAHLTDLMKATLQGKNPAQDESTHNVVSREISFPLELLDIPDNPVGFIVAGPYG
jgi:hypothetical protein